MHPTPQGSAWNASLLFRMLVDELAGLVGLEDLDAVAIVMEEDDVGGCASDQTKGLGEVHEGGGAR